MRRGRRSRLLKFPVPTHPPDSLSLALSSAAEQLIEGQTITFNLRNTGTDIRSVEYVADGTSLGTVESAPFELALTLPAHVPHIQIRAIARDASGVGVGFAVHDFDIAPERSAVLRGYVSDSLGNSLAGVAVRAFYHGLRAEFFDFDTAAVHGTRLKRSRRRQIGSRDGTELSQSGTCVRG